MPRVTSSLLTPLIVGAIALAAAPSASAIGVERIDPSPFALHDSGGWAAGDALIDELVATRGLRPATVARVLRSANRKVRPLGRTRATRGVRRIVAGFRWKRGDDATREWYPQGITGSSDAVADSVWGRNRVLLVSWYSKRGKGVRISFVRANSVAKARYRHVLLVEPRQGGDFAPVRVHAGGIAWYGRWLYVADTANGLRVFDVRRMLEVSGGKTIGCGSARCSAAGYRFVLPQVAAYRQLPTAGLRFSFVSVNRGTKPDSLLAGEYRRGRPGGRLVRWRLDASTGRLAADAGGTIPAWAAFTMPMRNVQGALSTGGRFLITTSAGTTANGSLWTARIGRQAHRNTWGVGPEDLTHWPRSDRVFSLTEHPGKRTVFAVRARKLR